MLVEVVLCVALVLLVWQVVKKPKNLPPGRWGLPLVGSLPLSFKTFEEHLKDLKKQHGNIYIWRIGSQLLLFLSDQKLAREAFASTDFIDRPLWKIFNFNEESPKGLVGSNGLLWHNNRRFALRQLRDLGMGKSKLVTAVHTQANMLVQEFKKQVGHPAQVTRALTVAITNIIWQMVGGIQFEPSDQKLKRFNEIITEVLDSMKYLAFIDLFPWINKVLPARLVSSLFHVNKCDSAKEKFFAYFKEVVDHHRKTLDHDNPRDLIDAYLIEMEKDNPDSTCSERDLLFVIFDLFNAGSLTTRDSTIWMIFYLANHPDIQKKLQHEIDEVLPRGTLPTLEDKSRLPYTEAVIHELLRMSSLAALGAQHVTTQDTQLAGYLIPKGTVVSGYLSEIHRDTRHWDNPDDFIPERWLDSNGKFSAKKEGFMPFGSGKRQCVGEGLARMELYIFTVALFQNFSFAPPAGKILDLRPNTSNPIGHNPRDSQTVVATLRP